MNNNTGNIQMILYRKGKILTHHKETDFSANTTITSMNKKTPQTRVSTKNIHKGLHRKVRF